MKQKSSTISYLIISMIMVVVLAGVYAFIYNEIGKRAAVSSTAITELASERANKDHEKILNETYISTAPDRERVLKQFIPYDQAVGFIEQVEGISKVTGAVVNIVSIDQSNLSSATPGTVGTITATIDAHGTWKQVMQTLRFAENLPLSVVTKAFQIQQIGVSGGGTGSGKANVSGKSTVWRIGFQLEALSIK